MWVDGQVNPTGAQDARELNQIANICNACLQAFQVSTCRANRDLAHTFLLAIDQRVWCDATHVFDDCAGTIGCHRQQVKLQQHEFVRPEDEAFEHTDTRLVDVGWWIGTGGCRRPVARPWNEMGRNAHPALCLGL